METPHIDVYQIITNRIIEQLEQGKIPWQKPWTDAGHPQNLITKRLYTGMNVWMLASLGYVQNYFLTWKQLKELGGSVKKGEKGHMVIFWQRNVPQQKGHETTEHKPKSFLRYYYVFNIAQVDNLPEILSVPPPVYHIGHLGACDEIIERMPNCPKIKHSKHMAFYDPAKDYINLPKPGSFANIESYYSTAFHELVHSTGHPTRLNRKAIAEPIHFGSEPYSIEELTAEIGCCYLNSVAGIVDKGLNNSVAYISGWLDKLKGDKRLIIFASGQAQRATDFILNFDRTPEGRQAEKEMEVLV
jgi:antirestriction protein ArdC